MIVLLIVGAYLAVGLLVGRLAFRLWPDEFDPDDDAYAEMLLGLGIAMAAWPLALVIGGCFAAARWVTRPRPTATTAAPDPANATTAEADTT